MNPINKETYLSFAKTQYTFADSEQATLKKCFSSGILPESFDLNSVYLALENVKKAQNDIGFEIGRDRYVDGVASSSDIEEKQALEAKRGVLEKVRDSLQNSRALEMLDTLASQMKAGAADALKL